MRNQAHVEKIKMLTPIAGADKIEKATVLGWAVVVKKGEFKEGDLICYIEIDSIVPDTEQFQFLKDRKFRVRTIKLRGQVSQGLIIPVPKGKWKEGQDCSAVLGIKKYDPEAEAEAKALERSQHIEKSKIKRYLKRFSWYRKLFLSKKQKQSFPYWIPKTDEDRIQSMPQILEQFAGKRFYVTEKIDYQSVTFFTKTVPYLWIFKKRIFGVCSRNIQVFDKNTLYWEIAEKYNLEKIMLSYSFDFTIQGEQGNTNIQGNKYGITEPTLWVFNIFCTQRDVWGYRTMKLFCLLHGIPIVPLLEDEFTLPSTVTELVEYAKGKSVLADVPREGVVIRCVENGLKKCSFKVINPDFLLKYDI